MKYYIDTIEAILRGGISKNDVKYYLQGEPENIPKEVAEYGFIILEPISQTISPADTSRDENNGSIRLVLGVQVREFYNKKDYIQDHLQRCMEIFEGRDSSGNLKTNTVLYLLRQSITDIGLNEESIEVDYTNIRDESYIYAISCIISFYDQRNRT